MKCFRKIVILFFIVSLMSCDRTTYVAVRNYKKSCKVNVTYEVLGNPFFNSDTLLLKNIGNPSFDSLLIRTNTSSNSYSFVAPSEKEIALKPVSFGQPINQIEIISSSDTAWKINLRDKIEFKRLKKLGRIKTRGFVFMSSIVIENK